MIWLSLLTKKYVWIPLVIFIVVGFLWAQFGGSIVSRWIGIPQAEKALTKDLEDAKQLRLENQRLLGEYEATQNAVRGLSQKIMDLRKEADTYKKTAEANAKKALEYEKDTQLMALKLQAILKQRADEQKVRSLQEAKDVFEKAGIK